MMKKLFFIVQIFLIIILSNGCTKQTSFDSTDDLIDCYVQSMVVKDISAYVNCLDEPLKSIVDSDSMYLSNMFRHLVFVDYHYHIIGDDAEITYIFKDNEFEYETIEKITISSNMKISTSQFIMMDYNRVYIGSPDSKLAFDRFSKALLAHSYYDILAYNHLMPFEYNEENKWNKTIIKSLKFIGSYHDKYFVIISCLESEVNMIEEGVNVYTITISDKECYIDDGSWCVIDFDVINR
ncbi:MAG: hypothetical protein VB009_04655 [Erysipelotrichaceae bacterium]|nr:hypothetical protein [Erysipelotrichaceae bacterium]